MVKYVGLVHRFSTQKPFRCPQFELSCMKIIFIFLVLIHTICASFPNDPIKSFAETENLLAARLRNETSVYRSILVAVVSGGDADIINACKALYIASWSGGPAALDVGILPKYAFAQYFMHSQSTKDYTLYLFDDSNSPLNFIVVRSPPKTRRGLLQLSQFLNERYNMKVSFVNVHGHVVEPRIAHFRGNLVLETLGEDKRTGDFLPRMAGTKI